MCTLGLLAVGAMALSGIRANRAGRLKFRKGMSVKDCAKIDPEFEKNLEYRDCFHPPIWEKMIRQKIDDTDCDVFLRFNEKKILGEIWISPLGLPYSGEPRDDIPTVQKWWDGVKNKDLFQGWSHVNVSIPNYLEMITFVQLT